MAQMKVDDLVKLLDSFSQKGGSSIKPQFDGKKANFVVGNGETLSTGLKSSVEELSEYLVESEKSNPDIFIPEDPNACPSCANIPNMKYNDRDKDWD